MNDEQVAEYREVEPGTLVMPFYLICDVSYSMSSSMKDLNDGLQQLHQAIAGQPIVDDVAQVCIISFSDVARVLMPLSQMTKATVPTLAPEGGTQYGAAFRELAQTIEFDRANLKSQGYKIYRPCAFFLTDGAPLDGDWHRVFKDNLTYDRQTGQGMKAHPIFVPFGFRDAPEKVLRQLAYPPERGKWYLASKTTVEQALEGILEIIMKTVVTSARTANSAQPTVMQQAPAPGSGITQGDSDYDPDYVD
jgi:uncharacterized protein YegL